MADTPQQDRKAGLPRERQGGRYVTAYSPELALKICERIAEGETLGKVCEGKGMPHRTTFRRWLLNEPLAMKAYEIAREVQAHSLFEEALDLARDIRENPGSTQKVRAFDISMNHLRWAAGKLNPRIYSEKASVQFTVPIQIITSIDLGQGGKTGAGPNAVYEVEAKIVEEGEPEAQDRSGKLVEKRPPGRPRKKRGRNGKA